MLSFSDTRGPNRRDFLRVGSLALGGLSLSGMIAAQAAAGDALLRGKSVIFLLLHGGPSQFETFDPKMSAPTGNCSVTGETSTNLPGVTFGSTFEKLAARADKLTIVRSFQTGDGEHDVKPIVSKATKGANIGTLFSRIAGANHPETGMPRNVSLFPRAVDPETQPANETFGRISDPGEYGAAFAPFVFAGSNAAKNNMRLTLPQDRFDDRRALHAQLDRWKRSIDSSDLNGLDQSQQQAYRVLLGGVADAFDLAKEDPKLVDRYDTASLARPDQISRAWNNYRNYVDNAKTLGKLLLLARRLCERGAGFVTVTTNFVWDMHADVNNCTMGEGMRYMGTPLDHALAAFIDDVESRGLSDDILLVVTGEMGRTPKVNAKGGRDHWGYLTPLLLYGGGHRRGQVIGQSNRIGAEPATEPYRIPNLVSTILHTLCDVGQLRLATGLPDSLVRAASEPRISGLFS